MFSRASDLLLTRHLFYLVSSLHILYTNKEYNSIHLSIIYAELTRGDNLSSICCRHDFTKFEKMSTNSTTLKTVIFFKGSQMTH